MIDSRQVTTRNAMLSWWRLAGLAGLLAVSPATGQSVPAGAVKAYAADVDIKWSGTVSGTAGGAFQSGTLKASARMTATLIDKGQSGGGILTANATWTVQMDVKATGVGQGCTMVTTARQSATSASGEVTLKVTGGGPYHWVFSDSTAIPTAGQFTVDCEDFHSTSPLSRPYPVMLGPLEGDSSSLQIEGKVSRNSSETVAGLTSVYQEEITYKFTPLVAYEEQEVVCKAPGSVIGCESQSLGEIVPVVGTSFRLPYQSDRVPGRPGANASWLSRSPELGTGWSLNVHHAYDPTGTVLYLGTGAWRGQDSLGAVKPVGAAVPGVPTGGFLIAAEDGSEVYAFDPSGRHLRTMDAFTAATIWQFSYDAQGRLTRIVDGHDNATTIERDGRGSPVAIVGPDGHRTALTTDAAGNLTRIGNPAGESVQIGYGPGGLLTSFTDPLGNTSRYTYDSSGRLIKAEDRAGAAKQLVRTERTGGYNVTLTTAMKRTTSYEVESASGKRTVRFPTGLGTETVKVAGGVTTRFGDGARMEAAQAPDPRWGMQAPVGQSVSVSTPGGARMSKATTREVRLANPQDPFSLTGLTETIVKNGATHILRYDSDTRTLSRRSPLGRMVTSVFDAKGRVVEQVVGDLEPFRYFYDKRGRLEAVSRGEGEDSRRTRITWGPSGDLEAITDSLGFATRYKFDAAQRVISQTLEDGGTVAYSYDRAGRIVGVAPPGRAAHVFSYTSTDLQSAYVPPDTGVGEQRTAYTYNADGQFASMQSGGTEQFKVSYDDNGRVRATSQPGRLLTFTYKAEDGRLESVTAADGSALLFAFDGPLPVATTWSGEISGSVTRTFDDHWRVAEIAVNGVDKITREYDADGLLVRAGELELTYHPQNGLVTSARLGELSEAWTYNSFGEVIEHKAFFQGTPLYSARFTYDKLGRIVQRIESLGDTVAAWRYSYDAAGRLVEVNKDGEVTSYLYDANGNRVSEMGPHGQVAATYDQQDKVIRRGDKTYDFDASGQLASVTAGDAGARYDYDLLGNLRGVVVDDGRKVQYMIDPLNRRVGKKVDGALVRGFLYQDSLRPTAELDGANVVVSRFVYGDRHAPEYMVKGGMAYRILADHVGSPRLVVNTRTGEIVHVMEYDAFGNVTKDTSPGFQPFGFAGGIYDPDTKLVRFGLRDYDAEAGRWTAREPLLFDGGDSNLYVYAGNDPVNAIDQSGGVSWKIFKLTLRKYLFLTTALLELGTSGKSHVVKEVARQKDLAEQIRREARRRSMGQAGGPGPDPPDLKVVCWGGLEWLIDFNGDGRIDEQDAMELVNPHPLLSWGDIQVIKLRIQYQCDSDVSDSVCAMRIRTGGF